MRRALLAGVVASVITVVIADALDATTIELYGLIVAAVLVGLPVVLGRDFRAGLRR